MKGHTPAKPFAGTRGRSRFGTRIGTRAASQSIGLVCIATLLASSPGRGNELAGTVRLDPNAGAPRAIEFYQGDLGAEIGLGCSNESGTSGGPNYVAVAVTSPLATFNITAHYYHIFTQVSPNITSLTFCVWGPGTVPGETIATQTGLDFGAGVHTVAIAPAILLQESLFYFGHTQPQTDVGLRWGLDTSSNETTRSFLKASGCGLDEWTSLDAIGFPGNWVLSVSVSGGSVPVELMTWGQVKNVWR